MFGILTGTCYSVTDHLTCMLLSVQMSCNDIDTVGKYVIQYSDDNVILSEAALSKVTES